MLVSRVEALSEAGEVLLALPRAAQILPYKGRRATMGRKSRVCVSTSSQLRIHLALPQHHMGLLS